MKRLILPLSLITAILSGCGTAQLKKTIATDLQAIADQQDCPTTCELLKEYIQTKLAGL